MSTTYIYTSCLVGLVGQFRGRLATIIPDSFGATDSFGAEAHFEWLPIGGESKDSPAMDVLYNPFGY